MRNRTKDKEVCVQCDRDYKAITPKVAEVEKIPVVQTMTIAQTNDAAALKRLEEEKQKILQQRLAAVAVTPA